jgi:hypothetical protein
MKLSTLTFALTLSLGTLGAMAAPTAVVEGVQMPAWVERAGVKQALAAGMELQAADRVITGANSRLLLRLAEGSQVKIGENALLALDRLSQRQDNRQTFLQAAIDVARGAFRFTTDARAKLVSRREIDIRVSTVTAGIRGTDLWGRSADDRDIVCLIEGKIAVQRAAEQPVNMDQALQFYIAPKANGRPDTSKPVQLATIDPELLKQWAAQTEFINGQGITRRGGKWKVVAASSEDPGVALMVVEKLRVEGYAAAVFPAGSSTNRTYDARIDGLPSRAEAEALSNRIEPITGVKGRAST